LHEEEREWRRRGRGGDAWLLFSKFEIFEGSQIRVRCWFTRFQNIKKCHVPNFANFRIREMGFLSSSHLQTNGVRIKI
jgi:hypothetical protein